MVSVALLQMSFHSGTQVKVRIPVWDIPIPVAKGKIESLWRSFWCFIKLLLRCGPHVCSHSNDKNRSGQAQCQWGKEVHSPTGGVTRHITVVCHPFRRKRVVNNGKQNTIYRKHVNTFFLLIFSLETVVLLDPAFLLFYLSWPVAP